jgi:hypothetical protein
MTCGELLPLIRRKDKTGSLAILWLDGYYITPAVRICGHCLPVGHAQSVRASAAPARSLSTRLARSWTLSRNYIGNMAADAIWRRAADPGGADPAGRLRLGHGDRRRAASWGSAPRQRRPSAHCGRTNRTLGAHAGAEHATDRGREVDARAHPDPDYQVAQAHSSVVDGG